ncbi:cytochrome P450 [Candidatus Promineifilum breve]|uniref:cytochrome P450 n=1 Tax=Candidatus Promineifilum breve TaxID=1806508 RepID=UPI0012FF6AA2|nr:cytochrome P450 [Candidatus Promineifilum breve]
MEPFDVFDPAFRADPYPVYARYRAGDAVHRGRAPTPDGPPGWWYLFRHADVAAVLKDSRFGRAIAPALDEPPPPVPPAEREPFWDMYAHWTLALEPPEHTRQRALLSEGFTARVVAGLRPAIAAQAAALLDALTPRGRFDVVADYAFPLTLSVIAALIGIPQSDLARVKAWSLIIADVLDYKRTWDVMAAGNRMTAEFTAYLADIVAARRARPENDLISRLLAAVAGEARLAEDELIALCVMLLFAGHETTVNLISAGALLLLTQPEQLALFRARPELTDTAVDEILRLHSPIQATTRIAYADVTLGDRLIRRGESVTLLLGAANRDPAAFPDPNRLDIARRPNRHLAFGRGIHFCLGAPLAMAQGGLALRLLFERSTDWRLACNPIWSETFGFRGLTSLSIGKFSSRCA